jgi:hypothetical protein
LKIEKKNVMGNVQQRRERDWNIEGAEGAIETPKDIRQQKYGTSVLKLLTSCIFNQIIFSYQNK